MTLAVFVAAFLVLMPRIASADEPPVFLLKWGGVGTNPGQFGTEAPGAVDVAPDNSVFAADDSRIQKFTSQGAFLLTWGISAPRGLAVGASGTVYVSGQSMIRKYNGVGNLLGQFPTDISGIVAVDPGEQYVYLAGGYQVSQYTTDGVYVRGWITINTTFASNNGIAVGPYGDVYVSEANTDRVWKYTGDGIFVTSWGGTGSGDGQLSHPTGVDVDDEDNVYVCDGNNRRIVKFSGTGMFLTKWGTFGTGDGQFAGLRDVAVDSDGAIYVADSGRHNIQKFGDAPTVALPTSWGRLKTRYLDPKTGR